MSTLSDVDRWLFRHIGYPYLRTTRDDSIFDRIYYLISVIRANGRRVRLLDVGCGSGLTLYMLNREIPELINVYVGLDLNARRLESRYAHVLTPHQFFNVDVDDDWNYGLFDAVWCAECLEHILDDVGVFRKLCRSARPGGDIIVTMPSESCRKVLGPVLPELLVTSPVQDGGHVRIGYTPASMVQLAAGSGADLMRIDAVTKFDETYARRRYRWPEPLHFYRNVFYTLMRREVDRYKLSATPVDLSQYHSIAAVYRVK